jgi:hypothetical protein
MAKKFLTGLNLVVLDTDPATGSEGELYFNSSASVAKIYQAGSWSVLGAGDVDSKSTSSVYLVRNNTGSTILKGTLVSASGAEPSGRIDVEPFAAVPGINSELTVMGMATANISNGVNGEVISFGTLTGLDTRGNVASSIAVGDETWAAGDILFAHPTVAGKLTKVRPQHDLAVAFITVRHASTGQIAVRIVPGNNHLEWMHDVSISGSVQNNDLLSYDLSNGVWTNKTAEESGLSLSSHNHTLDSLSNVDINSLNDGDALIWSSASSSWINQVAEGGAKTTVSETAPESPEIGDSWYKNDTGEFYVYDGTYWVEVNGVVENYLLFSVGTSPQEPAITGAGWFNNVTGSFYIYDGTYWVEAISIVEAPELTQEQMQDYIAPLFNHNNHSSITASYNDESNKIILSLGDFDGGSP